MHYKLGTPIKGLHYIIEDCYQQQQLYDLHREHEAAARNLIEVTASKATLDVQLARYHDRLAAVTAGPSLPSLRVGPSLREWIPGPTQSTPTFTAVLPELHASITHFSPEPLGAAAPQLLLHQAEAETALVPPLAPLPLPTPTRELQTHY